MECVFRSLFFVNDPATTEIYTLSYTTLFRSLLRSRRLGAGVLVRPADRGHHCGPRLLRAPLRSRSEEHTSELQSQSNLVCRLLLEKKKPDFTHRLRREPIYTRRLCLDASLLL